MQVDVKAKRPKRSPKGGKSVAPPPEEVAPTPQGFVVDGFPRTEAQVGDRVRCGLGLSHDAGKDLLLTEVLDETLKLKTLNQHVQSV
jgi:hypothetical protein